jgi:hypothetical protein
LAKRLAGLARAVNIGTSRSTGWHSAPPPTCSRPLLSVTYSRNIFGSRVAYSSCVVQDRFKLFLLKTQKGETNMFATDKRKNSVPQLLSFLVLSLFALTIFAGKARAQIIGDLDADIAFQFHAGNTKLPAGKYRIHVLDNSDLTVMEIVSADGSTSALFQVQESDANSAPAKSELIFNKYGNQYFLAKLFDEDNPSGSELIESRYEKQLRKTVEVAQEHVPAHRRTQQGN